MAPETLRSMSENIESNLEIEQKNKAAFSGFFDFVGRNFQRLDSNRDGNIGEAEIDKAFLDCSIKGKDAVYLNVLKDSCNWLPNVCVTDQSLQDIIVDAAKIAFSTKSDSKISAKDIDVVKRYCLGMAISADEAKCVEVLEFEPKENLLIGINNYSRVLSGTTNKLFANSKEPLKNISTRAIAQQNLGDCYLLGPLSSQVNAHPKDVYQMFHLQKDASVKVIFPGDKAHPIVVPPLSQAKLIRFNGNNKEGNWPVYVISAYAKYRSTIESDMNGIENYKSVADKTPLAEESLGYMGNANKLLFLLSARKYNQKGPSLPELSDAKLIDILKDMQGRGVPSVLSTNFPPGDSRQKKIDLLLPSHIYAFIGLDRAKKVVRVKDPYGYNLKIQRPEAKRQYLGDGIIELSIQEVRDNFAYLAVDTGSNLKPLIKGRLDVLSSKALSNSTLLKTLKASSK